MPEKPTPSLEQISSPESRETEGETLSLEEFDRIFQERPELIDKMKEMFNINFNDAFECDAEGRAFQMKRGKNILIRKFIKYAFPKVPDGKATEKRKYDRTKILGESEKNRDLAELALLADHKSFKPTAQICFVFSKATRYKNLGTRFSNPDDMKFEGIFLGKHGSGNRVPISEAGNHEQFSTTNVKQEAIRELMKYLEIQTQEHTEEAIKELERITSELDINPERLEKLKQAIIAYATYIKSKPETKEECSLEVGRCMSIPGEFQDFCKEWFDLNVGTDYYHIQSSYGGSIFFHEINLFDDKIAIDWTARQFKSYKEEPYPFIYEVGSEKIPKSWEKLRHLKMKNNKE